jgi:hypothetical protein
MKKMLLLIAAFITASGFFPLYAQKTLTPTVTIQLPEGDGSNAAAVVWHPVTKKYYTSMVGNAIYSMGIYNANGKPFKENIDAEHDYRGFWYNPVSKRIEFNCYNTGGIGYFELYGRGLVTKNKVEFEGMNQPQDQNVGVYYPSGNHIIYLNTATYAVEKYSAKTGLPAGTLTTLRVGCKKQNEADDMDADTESSRWEGRNMNSVQYTGMAKAELAILNYDDRIIELYDQKTGLMSSKFFKIPESVTIHLSFNFCYNNGLWWFFNKDERKWVGCK